MIISAPQLSQWYVIYSFSLTFCCLLLSIFFSSVEALLESTAESQEALEDIGYNEKSDVRLMIEKFVDENPDAVASLLRNWLNEDWE